MRNTDNADTYSDLKLRDHRSDTNGLAQRWFLRRNTKNACLISADARRQGVWNNMHYPCRVLRFLKKPRAWMLMLANDFDWTSSPVLDICNATCLQHRVEIDLTSWGGVGRGTHTKHTRMLPRGRHDTSLNDMSYLGAVNSAALTRKQSSSDMHIKEAGKSET